VDGNVGVTLQKLCKSKHMSRDLTPSQAVSFKTGVYGYIIFKELCVFIVEHYLQSHSYVKYQEYFSSASPKHPVPDKSKVVRLSSPFS
jgi:hypothetical protein